MLSILRISKDNWNLVLKSQKQAFKDVLFQLILPGSVAASFKKQPFINENLLLNNHKSL